MPGKWITFYMFWRIGFILCLWMIWDVEVALGQSDSLMTSTVPDQFVTVSPPAPPPPSPTGALLRSTVFPGWGQVYNRKPVKGVILLLLEASLLTGVLLAREHPPLTGLTPAGSRLLFGLIGTHIYGMTDAYVDAHLADFDAPDVFGHFRRDKPAVVVGLRVTW